MKTGRRHGYALVIAIVVLMLLTTALSTQLKTGLKYLGLTHLITDQKLGSKVLLADAAAAQEMLSSTLDERGGLYTGSNRSQDEMQAELNTWLTRFVDSYNSNHLDFGTNALKLECLYEMTSTGSAPCTLQREVMPKIFRMTLSRLDSQSRVFLTTIQDFRIDNATINQYAYLITSAPQDIFLGDVTFHGPTAFFFENPSPEGGNTLVFSGTGQGTVFEGPLITNLTDAGQFSFKSDAKVSLNRLALNTSTELNSNIQANFGTLVSKAPKSNIDESNVLAACQAAANGPSRCHVQMAGSFEVSAGNTCSVKVVQIGRWTDDLNPANNCASSNSCPSHVIYDGAQVDGSIYYLKGAVTIGAPNKGPVSSLCAKQTFVADQLQINNSIVKQFEHSNAALVSSGALALAPDPEMVLMNGQSGITVEAAKASGKNLLDQTSLSLQVSLLSTQGSVVVPPTFYDNNPGNFGGLRPITLGNFSVEGLIVSEAAFLTSQSWMINGSLARAGFARVDITQDRSILTAPPPGINFKVNKGLVLMIDSISNSNMSVDDALAQISSH